MTPSLGSINLLEWLTESRKTVTYIYQITKVQYIVKDTDEQPNAEIRRVRFRRVLPAGASIPVELRILLIGRCVHPPEGSLNCTFGTFMEVSSCRLD